MKRPLFPGVVKAYICSMLVELLMAYSNQTEVRFSTSDFTTTLQFFRPETPRDQGKRKPKQRHRRLTKSQTQELIDRYQAGETARQLGEAFKINKKTVCKILKREGIPTRHRKLSESDIDQAIELYESGLSLQAVGDQLGVEPATILNHFKRLEIPRRSVGTNQWSSS